MLEAALERTRDWLLVPAARRRPLGRRARRRHDPRIGIHPAAGLPGPRDRSGLRQGVPLHPRSPAARGRLDDLSRRPARGQRLGEGVLRTQARGHSPDDPALVRAREAILEAGGAQACNSFTRFYLALLGQIGYDDCPSVPPELVLIPSRLNFSLSAMSAWTRTIVVPLSIMSHSSRCGGSSRSAGSPSCSSHGRTPRPRGTDDGLVSWTNFFLGVDRVLKWVDRWVPASWRQRGIKAAHRWMLEHFENTDGLGAIFPPMIYTVIALKCLGYDPDSPAVQWAWRQLDDLHDRGGRHGPAAALPLAGLGHGDRHDRPGRRRPARATSPRWPAPSTGCSTRRSATRATGRSAGPGVEPTRLALPVSQRVLPRHRRHGDGVDGPASGRRWPTIRAVQAATRRGVELAAGDAEPRRRLGGVRRRHRQPGADQGAVRRPQRHARPELRRHHRPRARAARARSATGPITRRSPAAWTISGGPRSRRAAGTAAGASTTSTAPGRCCRA